MELNKPLLSVIIPVYKVEKYLDECMKSVVGQSYRNLEIVLVDDGSPDSSGEMCDRWAEKDSRVRVVHKENEGAGLSRNAGLRTCSGEYVAFVDSDDYIDTGMYDALMREAVESDADVVFSGGFRRMFSDGRIEVVKDVSSRMVLGEESIQDVVKAFITPDNEIFHRKLITSVWRGVYRRSVVSSFVSERVYTGEDLMFNVETMVNASKVVFIPEIYHNYRYNCESITRRYSFAYFEGYKKLTNRLDKILAQKGYSFRSDYLMLQITVDTIHQLYLYGGGFAERKKNIHGMVHDSVWERIEINTSVLPRGTRFVYRYVKSHSARILFLFTECYYLIRKLLRKSK